MESNISLIISFLQKNHIFFERNVDLKAKTWIKRGGRARVWVQPNKLSEFETLINWCQLNKLEFEVIGNTSNCYFLNSYNPNLVISTLKLKKMTVEGDTITCECGCNISLLARYCISKGIGGFAGFIGLPGTVGGAAINNSGCYDSLIANIVSRVTILKDAERLILTNKQMHYGHRNSVLKSKEIEGVVMLVTFNAGFKEEPLILTKRADEFQNHRKIFQEHIYPNLGTTFSTLELKKFPFFRQCVYVLTQKIITTVFNDSIKGLKIRTKVLLLLLGAGSYKNYISEYGIGCFVWKDEGADEAFKEYVDFIGRNTMRATIEIDIKEVKN